MPKEYQRIHTHSCIARHSLKKGKILKKNNSVKILEVWRTWCSYSQLVKGINETGADSWAWCVPLIPALGRLKQEDP